MFELLTERLRIRPYRPGDVEDLAAILSDAQTLVHWEAPLSREEVVGWVGRAIERHEREGLANWAVEDRGTGVFLGNCGIQNKHVEGEPVVEAGWHFGRAVWNRGYATEAAKAVMDHGLLDKKFERIVALIVPENVASWRVAEKIGMKVVGVTFHAGVMHDIWEVR